MFETRPWLGSRETRSGDVVLKHSNILSVLFSSEMITYTLYKNHIKKNSRLGIKTPFFFFQGQNSLMSLGFKPMSIWCCACIERQKKNENGRVQTSVIGIKQCCTTKQCYTFDITFFHGGNQSTVCTHCRIQSCNKSLYILEYFSAFLALASQIHHWNHTFIGINTYFFLPALYNFLWL